MHSRWQTLIRWSREARISDWLRCGNIVIPEWLAVQCCTMYEYIYEAATIRSET